MEIKSAALIGVGAVGSYFAYGLRRSRLHFLRLWMISAHLWVRIRLS